MREPVGVAVADQGFVPARPDGVFRLLVGPRGYPGWWPGARARRQGDLALPALGRLAVEIDGVRPGVGLYMRIRGRGFQGHLEWYLEPFKEGTVVHCITNIEAARWSDRRTLAVRAGIRGGMVALRKTLG